MTGKKKSMDGGKLFELLKKKPIFTEEHNTYLNQIKKLNKINNKIKKKNILI